MSKIIELEKERQVRFLKERDYYDTDDSVEHKQSLINLKEYMEELYPKIYDKENVIKYEYDTGNGEGFNDDSTDLKEDIEELDKMIKRYV